MTILFLCFFPLRRYLNHSSQYLSTFLNTSKFVKNTQYALYFQLLSQCLEMWWNTVFRVRYSISKTWPFNWIVCFVKLFYKKSRFLNTRCYQKVFITPNFFSNFISNYNFSIVISLFTRGRYTWQLTLKSGSIHLRYFPCFVLVILSFG